MLARVASRVHIVPSDIGDVYRLASHMREDDRLEAVGLGGNPTQLLRASYRSALLRKTAFVDGEIAAMWGLGGVALSDEGTPWLVTAPAVERIPVFFVKQARQETEKMLALRATLRNVVLASYDRACRFLHVVGFSLGDPEPMGPNDVLYRRFWMSR